MPNSAPQDGQSDLMPRPIIVGEVLWDCFIDPATGQTTRRVLGGAPLNVAWNLKGLGLDPIFVSAVGDDESGHEILERMRSWGLSTDAVAVLDDLPTGRVEVTLVDGEPHYDIVRGVAFDEIPISANLTQHLAEMPKDTSSVLYHGTLAYRGKGSRETIRTLRSDQRLDVYFDVNLRPPHYEPEWFDALVPQTSFLKLNRDELGEVLGVSVDNEAELRTAASTLLHQQSSTGRTAGSKFASRELPAWLNPQALSDLQLLLVTLGADGALCFTADRPEPLATPTPRPESMVDPVGAGDAFASVMLHGIVTRRPLQDCLSDAVEFASRVCGLPGATCDDPNFYVTVHGCSN